MLRSCCGAFGRVHFDGDKKVRLGVCVLSVCFWLSCPGLASSGHLALYVSNL